MKPSPNWILGGGKRCLLNSPTSVCSQSTLFTFNEPIQAGYREGITAGKDSALQEGFNDGYANIGVPLGHKLGYLIGVSSAILSFLTMPKHAAPDQEHINEMRDIVMQLSKIRLEDISPRDLEAEAHALQHLEESDLEMNGDVRGLASPMDDSLGYGEASISENLERLQGRLEASIDVLGLKVNFN